MKRRTVIALVTAALGVLAPALARAGSVGPIVRFSTSLGTIDVQLLSGSAPRTVNNFLGYVDRGDYAHTFFHRSVSQGINVIQGGGFSVAADGSINHAIPTQPPVANEFGVSNIRGTLAMALSGTDINSATDQWFFNVADDSASLDPQHFTVFGRILDPAGLAVMDAIASEPVLTTQPSPFDTLPVMNLSAGATASNVIVTPIARLSDTTGPVITISDPASGAHYIQSQVVDPQFSCDDATGTGVASCTASGPIITSTLGPHTFTVTASDYAANTSTQSVTYVVDPAPGAPNQGPPSPTPSPAPQLLGSLTASRRGAVSLKLRCAAGRRCVGTVTLYAATGTARHRRQLKLGGAHYAIAAGRRHTLSLRLSHAALSLLRSAHGHLNVQLAIAPANGRIRTGSHRLTLSKH